MGDVVSKAKLFIDYSGGSNQLKRVDSADVAFEHDLSIVTAIGVDGGAGYRKQTGGGEFSFEVYPETGRPEVDYLRLFFSEELFRIVIQEEDGQRLQGRYCRVAAPPGRKYNSKGDVMLTVKIKFLQFGTL
jgi:hypothetical protein